MESVLPLRPKKVSIIIVSHESADDLEQLLPLLTGSVIASLAEIVVIDNASGDRTVAVLNRFSKKITIVSNQKNLGFATAVNQGIACSSAPYVLLLNPDARLTGTGLETLAGYLDTHTDAAAVAPRIEFPDGRIQPSRGSFPSVIRSIIHLLQLKRLMPDDAAVMNGPLRYLGHLFKQYSPLPREEQTVDYTTGACVLLRRSALERVGGMDEHFFLYYEEIDLARRLKSAGYSWVFLNTVIASHSVAASSGKAPLRPFFERYRSMRYYFGKHHHPLAGFIVTQMLYLTILARWCLVRLHPRFRLDPGIPVEMETAMYRTILKSGTQFPAASGKD